MALALSAEAYEIVWIPTLASIKITVAAAAVMLSKMSEQRLARSKIYAFDAQAQDPITSRGAVMGRKSARAAGRRIRKGQRRGERAPAITPIFLSMSPLCDEAPHALRFRQQSRIEFRKEREKASGSGSFPGERSSLEGNSRPATPKSY